MGKQQDRENQPTIPDMRLDKWLWCARLYKTRGQANQAVKSGRVKLNGQKIKSGKNVQVGDLVSLKRGAYSLELDVTALAKSRLSAKDVRTLYRETENSQLKREKTRLALELADSGIRRKRGRPDKRERRQLMRFTGKRE